MVQDKRMVTMDHL